jgi:hypothetical protein
MVDKSDWSKCVYCKDPIPPGLQLTKICLNCLGKIKNKK